MKKIILLIIFFSSLFILTINFNFVSAQDGCTPGGDDCADRTGEIRNMYNNGRGCSYKCGRFTGACANSGHCILERIDDSLCEDTVAGNACGIPVGNTTPTQSVTLTPSLSPTASASALFRTTQHNQSAGLLMYIVISGIYLMTIHFAIGIKKQFQSFLMIGFFVFGGVIGYIMNSFEVGITAAIILSLVFW